jgi:hypothetical protein
MVKTNVNDSWQGNQTNQTTLLFSQPKNNDNQNFLNNKKITDKKGIKILK